MLDFYLIKDEQKTPDYPEQQNLEFAGDLDYKTYHNLLKKKVIDERFDYYSDFRWSKQIVEQILNTKNVEIDSDFDKLSSILIKATQINSGLIAYCD